ncbi:MAG: tetratricopeptide repeat protein [Magnetococcales bacterium]|nr:tetratricopeptide repeat protein [Magnetococcales bacterium]NGZ27007.1 tetratricopeptide repeat protein [Magnetococcales bacterium]
MSQMQDIFEQIDEELEAERVEKYWQANRGRIIAVLILFFVGLFAFVGWREYREKQDLAAAEVFISAMEAVEDGKHEEGIRRLQALNSQFSSHGYNTLAPLMEAKAQAAMGKPEVALERLQQLGSNAKAIPALRALAWLQAAYLVTDQPEKALGFLANIPADSAFQAPALELKGLFALAKGDRDTALAHFREALGKRPQTTLKERLDLMIQRLSVGATPAPAQP